MPVDFEINPALLHTAEGVRLASAEADGWRRWGPYVSERQWGTVREDYSPNGTAWGYLPHDQARSRAYRWGEDGIAGFCDDQQLWCLSIALWNTKDQILKERMFGLTNDEGNHGEDVKELWWYLDGTPTHSYQRMLYKYPQSAFPYEDLVAENGRRRGQGKPEYELVDTGVFDEGRYFDVAVEYAKGAPDDILMRVTVTNRSAAPAQLHVLGQVWARNIWSWAEEQVRPLLRAVEGNAVEAAHPDTATMHFSALQDCELLFCENETNVRRLYGMESHGFFKDAFNDFLVDGDTGACNPLREGTKCASLTQIMLQGGEETVLRFRWCPSAGQVALSNEDFDAVVSGRRAEADAFYAVLQQGIETPDARLVQRQAFASLLWSKQFYHYDVPVWLKGDPGQPTPPVSRRTGRNSNWPHLNNADVISMPDKWEYPWYAAWDLAFHCVAFAAIDPTFAKEQLVLLTREWFMHPNGQLPAYEWAFGDVNPPVHGWAALRVYRMDKALTGQADTAFLERVFHKLMLNFTWWVNRKDAEGRNIFEGGFLGLDNIGVFDRSAPLPTGGFINQSDGTAWMAMYALGLMRIALELALKNPVYEDIATKFFEHFLYIAAAMTNMGDDDIGLWDDDDAFYYDVLHLPDGERLPLKVRSLVGLIPLFAVEVLDKTMLQAFPGFAKRLRWMLEHRPELAQLVSHWSVPGQDDRMLLSLLRRFRMKAVLHRMLDETEFLSDHGIRSVSKAHAKAPYTFEHGGMRFVVDYEPAESTSGTFGGNSNWRGPIWMPINYMIVESLFEFDRFFGEDFQIEYPTNSGTFLPLSKIGLEIGHRLVSLFLRGANGARAFQGEQRLFRDDPHFRDAISFHEYFHGDTGAGLGASHQTGWTALVALLLQPRRMAGPP